MPDEPPKAGAMPDEPPKAGAAVMMVPGGATDPNKALPQRQHALTEAKVNKDGCWHVKHQPLTMAYARLIADAGWAQSLSYLADVQLSVQRDFVFGCGSLLRRVTGPKSTTIEALITTDVPYVVIPPSMAHLHLHDGSCKTRVHCGPNCTVAMPASGAKLAGDTVQKGDVVAPAAGSLFVLSDMPHRTTVLLRTVEPRMTVTDDPIESATEKGTDKDKTKKSEPEGVTNVYVLGYTTVHPNATCENLSNNWRVFSSRGQLPFVELNGKELADSKLAIECLSKHFEKQEEENELADNDRSLARAYECLIEESLFWKMVHWRSEDVNERMFSTAAMGDNAMPAVVRYMKPVIAWRFTSMLRDKCDKQGTGKYSRQELDELGKRDLKSLDTYLATREFMTGDKPTTYDATAFGHLCQLYYIPAGCKWEMRDYIENECGNIKAYLERMRARYWPDWQKACDNLDLGSHLPDKAEGVPAADK